MKKPQNLKIKLIALAVGLIIIPISYAGLLGFLETKPKIPNDLKDMPYQKWQDSESGRFAHSLKYEDKLNKSVPYSFTKGKNNQQESVDYFEHLCKTEGKDYIYRTAINVDSIAQLRSFEIPRESMKSPNYDPSYYKIHPYALEAPMFFEENLAAAMLAADNPDKVKTINMSSIRSFFGNSYINFQIKFNNDDIYNFKMDYDQLDKIYIKRKVANKDLINASKIEKLNKIDAKYGFTWRGFNRPKDREYGIAGGDLIIIDLEKNEIMAVQRTFINGRLSKNYSTNLSWQGIGCFEQYKNEDINKDTDFRNKDFDEKAKLIGYRDPYSGLSPWFIRKVLINREYSKKAQEKNK